MNRISWSWRHAIGRSELPFTTKGVLWAVSHFMNELGQGAYPTTKQLAEYCTLSERAICTHLQNAVDAGWLIKKEHGYKGRNWKNHEYHAQWPDENGDKEGTELGSVAWSRGTERHARGTEPDDIKALNQVQSIVPIQHSNKVSLDDGFDDFYEAYGKKVDRKQALDIWKKKKLSKLKDQILNAARMLAKQREPKFRKSPFRWLRDENWNDYQPQGASPSSINWKARIDAYVNNGTWLPDWGARPDMSGCKAPQELIKSLEK